MLIVNDMLTVTNASPDQIQVEYLNPFPTIRDNRLLLFLLHMYFVGDLGEQILVYAV